MNAIPALPTQVLEVIESLTRFEHVQEVWLIGSRANGWEKLDSDWDLLVFSSVEPTPVSQRSPDVDVIHVGPSRTILLEGQPACMMLPFSSFAWHPNEDGTASYKALSLTKFESGVVRDASEPSFALRSANAFRLWPHAVFGVSESAAQPLPQA